MKKILLLGIFAILSVMAVSQEYRTRFIGKINENQYQCLDSVKVTNNTRGWTEMVYYPDTLYYLTVTVNVPDNEMQAFGFEQNVPNPFNCYTSVELAIPQDENVKLQLFDATGKQCAELNVALNAGSHRFEITASRPQTYILKAVVGVKTYSVRMVNVGSCGGDGIKYGGSSDIISKLYSRNEFGVNDNMEFVGYATIDNEVEESRPFPIALHLSLDIILQFTHSFRPSVETLEASGIQIHGANLNGDLVSAGDFPVTECGFVYGTDPNDLSLTVISSATLGDFSVHISDLIESTTYYYKAYATNGVGTAYGEIVRFTTESLTVPTVVTTLVSNLTDTSATISGDVIFDGGTAITLRGFLWGTNYSELQYNVENESGMGSYTANLTGLTPGTIYYYKTYVSNSVGTAYGDVRSFVTNGKLNDYDWVDLGLPSCTRWATCNVGASNPDERGDQFAWGETVPKDTYDWSTYLYCNGSENTMTKYCRHAQYGYNGYTDNLTRLEANDDAATVNWGEGWRMPTKAELQELIDYCETSWVSHNGINGMLFTSRYNGNSIFMYGSQYWSSTLGNTSSYAWCLGRLFITYIERYNAQSVRPVSSPTSIPTASVPTVVTSDDISVTAYTATVSGMVISDGGAPVTYRAFMYGTDSTYINRSISSSSGNDNYSVTITGLTPNTTYYYYAYALNREGTGYGEVLSFTTEDISISYEPSGYLNDHGYIDLGLPSGLKWATCNVGANSPTEVGYYYAWGETERKGRYNWTTYSYCNGDYTTLTKYCNNSEYGYNGFTDNLTTLEASDAAAAVNWGAGWRMPTKEDFQELIDNCTRTITTLNGRRGILFTGPNGNSVFMCDHRSYVDDTLLDGCYSLYWTSSLYQYPYGARLFRFSETNGDCAIVGNDRASGDPVRPVCNPSR